MVKKIAYHLMLIRLALYKQFHNPTIMLSLIFITSLCITVLQLSSQLVTQIMHEPLPIKNADNSYQLTMQQGPFKVDGLTMLYSDALYDLKHWQLPINVVTQTTSFSTRWISGEEEHNITKITLSNNYLEQFKLKAKLGDIKNFDAQSVIVDQAFWHHNLLSDPNIIGTYMNISGQRYQIAAVLDTDIPIFGSIKQTLNISNNKPGMVLVAEKQISFVQQGESIRLESPDIFLQSRLSFTEIEDAVSTWVDEYNVTAPQMKQLSFNIDSFRKAMYGSWYYLAPSLLMASILILCIGLTAMGSLCLAHAGKTQRDVVLSYVLGANKYAVFLMEAWVALTISLVSNFIALMLCLIVDKYLQSLGFFQWSLSPSFFIVCCSVMVIWGCIFFLLTLPNQTIEQANLNAGLASSGKGQSGMFNLDLMKKIINVQVFSISIFLLLGVSYLMSNVTALAPLLANSYENIAYVQINKFHDKDQSQASQDVIVSEIKQQLNSHSNVVEVGMVGTNPLILSSSMINCSMPNQSIMMGKSYINANTFNLLEAKTLAGTIPLNQTQQQVIINKQAAMQFYGRIDNIIGEKLPCSGSSGEKQVAAVIDIIRFIPKELKGLIDAQQPMTFQAFDWKLMNSKASDVATFVIKFKGEVPLNLIDNINKKYKHTLELSPLKVLELELKLKGQEMRLSIALSSIITLATIIVACFSLYGGLKYQTMLREHQLAIFKCLGMPNMQLIFFIAKDNVINTTVSLLLALLMTTLFEFVYGEQSISLISTGFTIGGIAVIYFCASVIPCYQLMLKKNMRELIY